MLNIKNLLSENMEENAFYNALIEDNFSFDIIVSDCKTFVIYDLHQMGLIIYKNGIINSVILTEEK